MIAFSAPWALLGLFAAALPLLLHLAQRREPPEVAFPAVRYLDDTTREHRRRLKLRHWLLLAVRTLLIVALVLAAAGMRLRRARLGGHPASALVLILDNSASSSTIVDGTPVLDRLRQAARQVLSHATTADRLWLVNANGGAQAGSANDLQDRIDHLSSTATRLDLGSAVQQGRDLIRGSGLPGEVVVVSDMQRSALAAAPGYGDVLVIRPSTPLATNRGVMLAEPAALPWGVAGGDLRLAVMSTDTVPVPVTIGFGSARGSRREILLTPGVPATVHLDAGQVGWTTLSISIPPDEMRIDDMRQVAVRVAPPAVVRWNPGDRYISAAAEVLTADGRLVAGDAIRVGSLGPGASLVMPPEDAAQIGALNRALAARGIPWQYGTVIEAATATDSSTLLPLRTVVTRRLTLRATGAVGEVLATVQGEPWIVRGDNVLLLGSRIDPSWTELPLSADFVPLLDALLTRSITGAPVAPLINAGDNYTLPGLVTSIAHEGAAGPAEGGAPWRPDATGIYHFLIEGGDTLGAVSVHVDPRESSLERATDTEVRTLWPDAVVATLDHGPDLSFGAGRGELRKVLLIIAGLCVIAETLLARRGTRTSP